MSELAANHPICLAELLGGDAGPAPADAAVEITGLCDDSRDIQPGEAFVALNGRGGGSGVRYAEEAIARGARAVIAESDDEGLRAGIAATDAVFIHCAGLRERLPRWLERLYPLVPGQMKIIAVTGTNGKSTVVDLLRQLLPGCASMGSNGVRYADTYLPLRLTTTTLCDHFRQLYRLQRLGARFVAIEASSIGIDQGRLDDIPIDIAVFTNISRDHMDYHSDIASYAACKYRLFEERSLELAVINMACGYGRELAARLRGAPVFGYSVVDVDGDDEGNESDYIADRLVFEPDGIRFRFRDQGLGEERDCRSPLLCAHNIENLSAALAVALSLNRPSAPLYAKLGDLLPCPGRVEVYRTAGGRAVVVDYAHTPDALDKLLGGLRAHGHDQLSVVFGCGGGRDRGKRPLMAGVVARYAARAILTCDNPRGEDPDAIFADILDGFRGSAIEPEVISDRREAIGSALASDDSHSVVIAGRGDEPRQQLAGHAIDFRDLDVVRSFDAGQRPPVHPPRQTAL